jgi:hypothetical protein
MKIVKLEETLELLNDQNETQLQLTEEAYRQEIEEMKRGVGIREEKLLDQIKEIKEQKEALEHQIENME